MQMQVTCRNLARVNEDAIDFELLEELVAFIDDSLGGEGGAILVFLPGADICGKTCAKQCQRTNKKCARQLCLVQLSCLTAIPLLLM